MIYETKENSILVYDKSQFNPQQILECGQVFRYGKDCNNNYYVCSADKIAYIVEHDDFYEIKSDFPEYFINYFDLNTDYNKVKDTLSKNKILEPMVKYGYGIRILNGDPLEIIFSFIISQNNNIKRIQRIIEKLCELGNKHSSYNSFPTLEQLNSAPFEFYQSLGAGYRDKFLKTAAEELSEVNLGSINEMDTDALYKFLISLTGIGPKVASCILLFGFGRKNKFPVDTWIEQVYYNHFSKEKRTRPEIQKYFESEFGEYSGIAQQYLFYYERNKKQED